MTSPHPRILGVHGIASDGDWLADGLAVRVLAHPRLGVPLGPLAVAITGFGEHPDLHQLDIGGTGRGWRGNGEVDGTAWLRLVSTNGDSRPPISVRLAGDFEEGTRISVVRAPLDAGEGIMSLSTEPYVLWAPQVTNLRVEGRCRISEVAVSYPNAELIGGPAEAMGLPFGFLGPHLRPLYAGNDPSGSVAIDRVRRGAPRRPGPHESGAYPRADPANAEESRVKGLVFDASTDAPLAKELAAVLAQPHAKRLDPVTIRNLIADSPKETAGTRRRLEGILAAAGDPGVARWLGLAGTFDLPPEQVLSVTIAGRWILSPTPWARWVQTYQDEGTARRLLEAAGVAEQFGGQFHDLVSVYLWTQARVDLSVRPDPPRSPGLRANPHGVWIERDGRDVVRLPIAFEGVGPLAHGALVRTDGGVDVGVLPPSPGDAPRVRPLLVRDGTGVDLIADPPRNDGQYQFAGWQADMFGRWSDRSGDTAISSPPRPGLPAPEPQWRQDLGQGSPVGEDPFPQAVEVRVPVPRRRPGEPMITGVRVELGSSVNLEAAQHPGVVTTVMGPALGRAASITVPLSVTFLGDDGSSHSANAIPIEFIDPRAPLPPPRDPVLHFASPPDRRGIAGYAVPLPSGQGVTGWRVFVTTETRLLAAAESDELAVPDPGLSRDERASRWLAQQEDLKLARFDCMTPTPVGPGEFQGTLAGASTDILFVRPVPQRAGVEPPFSQCPMLAVAVPRTAAPAMPELTIDRSATPPVLRLTTHEGAVPADRYRLRLAMSLSEDPRTGVITAEGQLADAELALAVPALRPFARAWVMAEIRAVPEAGIGPASTRWSAISPPVELHYVPNGDPEISTPPTVTGAAGDFTVTVQVPGIAHFPVPGPYELRLYERVGAGPWAVVTTGPVAGETGILSFAAVGGGSYQVVLVDPVGRVSAPSAVTVP